MMIDWLRRCHSLRIVSIIPANVNKNKKMQVKKQGLFVWSGADQPYKLGICIFWFFMPHASTVQKTGSQHRCSWHICKL